MLPCVRMIGNPLFWNKKFESFSYFITYTFSALKFVSTIISIATYIRSQTPNYFQIGVVITAKSIFAATSYIFPCAFEPIHFLNVLHGTDKNEKNHWYWSTGIHIKCAILIYQNPEIFWVCNEKIFTWLIQNHFSTVKIPPYSTM